MTEKRYTTDYYEFIREDKTYVKDNDVRMTYNQIVDRLNEYELLINRIKKLCNQNRIPSLLTTYIPVNCEKRKSCLDNHMVNASNMGKRNLAEEILKVINDD